MGTTPSLLIGLTAVDCFGLALLAHAGQAAAETSHALMRFETVGTLAEAIEGVRGV